MLKQSYYLVLGVVIFSLLFLISCGGGGGGGSAPQSPRILISTTQIDFGDIILDDIAAQAFTIQNLGLSTLSIGPIAQTDPLAPPFSILNDACSGNTLTASQQCTITVQFSPTSQGEGFTDSFDIPSDDPHFPSVTVVVIGNAEGLRVSINQVTTDSCTNIELHMAVFNKDGIAVSLTTPDNVTLSENNEPMNIDLTNIGTILPDSVAMILDFSDSVSPFYPDVIASSEQFVDQLNSEDEAAIIKFGGDIELKQPFTKNKDDLIIAINDPYRGGIGATVLYDALWYAIDLTADRLNNRVIIVISDGKDENPSKPGLQGSVKTMTEVINHAKETGVSIFTIGLGNPVIVDVMSQLASETGGQFFSSPTSDQLTSIYQTIRDILNGQYRIIYTSAASDPITVRVEVDTGIYHGDAVKQVQGCL
jgi:VWFA-related protein